MKKLFNRITEKQARVLTLCLLGAAVVLLGMIPGVLDPLMEGIVGPMFQG